MVTRAAEAAERQHKSEEMEPAFPKRPGPGTVGEACKVQAISSFVFLGEPPPIASESPPVVDLISFVQAILKKSIHDVTDYGEIERVVRGLLVRVTHSEEAPRKYRVSGLTKQPARALTFQTSSGDSKTVKDHFTDKYSKKLDYDFLPCLKVGSDKKPTYLPMEVCNIVPGQRWRQKQPQVSAPVVPIGLVQSEQKLIIETIEQHNNYNSTNCAKEFAAEDGHEAIDIDARVLPVPTLKYHDLGHEKNCYPKDGQWNMGNKKMIHGAEITKWACLNFCNDLAKEDIGQFCLELANLSRSAGMVFHNSRPPIFQFSPKHVEEVHSMLRHQEFDFLLVILPDENGNLYGTVKRICETEIGVISQCCRSRNVKDKTRKYLASVAVKINAKAGGRSAEFAGVEASLPVVSDMPTIIFGADVTHPGVSDDTAPSIASVVACQAWREVNKYNGTVQSQGSEENTITGVESIVKDLLCAFKDDAEKRPQQLIFYRLGVCEGQFKCILEKEIPGIEKAWKGKYSEKPKITYIAVQKRHKTRLLRKDNKSGNVLPGTVVDKTICHPTEFDFFLLSHAETKVRGRPTHYHVLRDDNGFTADQLQSLTNNLCYTCASGTRPVSIPSPAYYAHKLAQRARCYFPKGSNMASALSSDSKDPPSGVKPRRRTKQKRKSSDVKPFPRIKDELKSYMFYC